ncbi:MAG: hypothetical protein ABL926_05995 [Novosphingobium sp.]|uniref:hypothetical protein n=1 Tax=Novosphingobium sp. TaxID=1874826 RepID=UPI0032B7FADB
MATLAAQPPLPESTDPDVRFAARTTLYMATVVVTGFSVQWLLGRSSFASPLRVHAHAVVFMGWVALFVAQGQLAKRDAAALHRTLGWVGAGWLVLMLGVALNSIVAIVRNGTVPFFFTPQQLLIADPMTLFGFIGLTIAAIAKRRQTDWHVRLHICAMSAIMGPAVGRILPMPLLVPFAFEAAVLVGLAFAGAGALRDWRRQGRVHPAWLWGIAVVVSATALADGIAYSPLGDGIYRAVAAGYPGAEIAGQEYPPPPPAP